MMLRDSQHLLRSLRKQSLNPFPIHFNMKKHCRKHFASGFFYNESSSYLECASFCGVFVPNSVAAARYDALIWDEFSTNCDAHPAECILRVHSGKIQPYTYVCMPWKNCFLIICMIITNFLCPILKNYKIFSCIKKNIML